VLERAETRSVRLGKPADGDDGRSGGGHAR
jgi:hypothetical protein